MALPKIPQLNHKADFEPSSVMQTFHRMVGLGPELQVQPLLTGYRRFWRKPFFKCSQRSLTEIALAK